jgi:hypothetical protein
MDIPKWPLNSADRIVHEFDKAEIQAMNQHATIQETLEQINSPYSGQNVRLKSLPRVHRLPLLSITGKAWGLCENELSALF